MKDYQDVTYEELVAINPNLRRAANQLGLTNVGDVTLANHLEPDASWDLVTGEYTINGAPSGLYYFIGTSPIKSFASAATVGGGGSTTGGSADLSPIQRSISALQEAQTKLAKKDAVEELRDELLRVDAANDLVDENQRNELNTLIEDFNKIKAADYAARINELSETIASNLQRIEQGEHESSDSGVLYAELNRKVAKLESDLAALSTGQPVVSSGSASISSITKTIENGAFDISDVGQAGVINISSVPVSPESATVLQRITGGKVGQIIFLRCVINMQVEHNSGAIRTNTRTNLTGLDGNRILCFFCLSGTGVQGGANVWLHTVFS